MSSFAIIIVAAGKSTRFADKTYKKPFAPCAGKAVWLHSAEKFQARQEVAQVVVVIAEEDRELFDTKFAANVMFMGLKVASGGRQRSDSVAAGLALVGDAEFVAIHDAARPCVTDREIDKLFNTVRKTGAGLLARPVTSTLKRGEGGVVSETVPRDGLWAAATPQAFRTDWLREAYAAADASSATDDAQLVERLGHQVSLVEGSPLNIKITGHRDLKLAEAIIKATPPPKPKGGHPFAGDDLWR